MANALFSTTQQRVLGLLFGQPGRSFYATELIGLAKAGSGAVQRELAGLEQGGLVTVRRQGTQKHFQANPDSPLFEELCAIASKALGAAPAREPAGRAVSQAHVLHEPVARYAAAPRSKLHIPKARLDQLCRKYHIRKLSLFGSAARNELQPDSDVDLMVEFDPQAKVSLWDIPKMQDEFSGIFGHRKVDIAGPEILGNPFRRRAIEPDLRILYEA